MEFQKVYLKNESIVSIQCPACMIEKKIPYEKISGRYRVKVKCTCGSVFGIQCEFREKYRKQVNLDGILLKPEQSLKWGRTLSESQETRIKPINCQICNISLSGIGLKVLDKIKIIQEDLLMV